MRRAVGLTQIVIQQSFLDLLLVAILAAGWPGFHFFVAIDTKFVGLRLVKASDLAASFRGMTESAVFQFVNVFLVGERNFSH